MVHTHTLGFPRMGAHRELKFALEKHWRGEIDLAALEATGAELRERHWAVQKEAGLDFVTVGDFAFYDHVANHIQMLGCEPVRFGFYRPGARTQPLLRDGAWCECCRAAIPTALDCGCVLRQMKKQGGRRQLRPGNDQMV
jgi:hypothetical protein